MRRKHGFTIGIILASLVLLVVLGLTFFYSINLFGGSRELVDAVDSGTAAIARKAVMTPSVALNSIPGDVAQFSALCDPPGSNTINLLTYNRLVGYAIIVSANSQTMGSSKANSNATSVWQAVSAVGQALTSQLNNSSNYASYFNQVTNMSNTSILGFQLNNSSNNHVKYDPSFFKTSYYNAAKASNIYITQALVDSFNALSPSLASQLNSLIVTTSGKSGPPGGSNAPAAPTGVPAGYLAGYKNIPFAPNSLPALVPVLPNSQAHLISKTEFNQSIASNVVPGNLTNTIPPNAYEAGGVVNRQVSNLSNLATAMAAATVGCPDKPVANNTPNSTLVLAGQYPLAMPGGYVKIYNYPGASNPGLGSFVTDASNSIYNNELFTPSSITMTDNGIFISGPASFASQAINAWAAYNNPANFLPATKTTPAKRNPALYPPNLGYPAPGSSVYRFGSGYNQLATIQDLENIQSELVSCTSQVDYGPGASGPCISNLPTWIGNYGTHTVAAQAPSGNYTAVEYMKTSLLEQWNNDGGEPSGLGVVSGTFNFFMNSIFGTSLGPTANVSPPPTPTGVKLFNHNGNLPSSYASQNLPPQQSPQYGTDGTPWQLLAHIGNMSYTNGNNNFQSDNSPPPANFMPQPGTALFNVYQRCQEIKPGIGINELYNALNSQPIALGQTFYLYLSPKTGLLTMDSSGPAQFTSVYGNAYLDQNSITPDGNPPSDITNQGPNPNLLVYSAQDTLVNTQDTGSTGGFFSAAIYGITGGSASVGSSSTDGDAVTQIQPFVTEPSVTGYDAANWIPASGYHNLLGVLQFQSQATGGGQYSSIN